MKLVKTLALALALAAAGVFVADAISPIEAHAAASVSTKKKTKKATTRGLASLAPVREGGQGAAMLDNVRSSHPRFLDGRAKAAGPVRLSGVCRDMSGATYYSSTQSSAYADCIGTQNMQTGKVDSYWGAAQRQAGAGISITGR